MTDTIKISAEEYRNRIKKNANGSLSLTEKKDVLGAIIPTLGTNKMYILNVNPIGKPRMTRSDKWKKRSAVVRYHEFKDEVLSELKRLGLNLNNTNAFNLCFIISMPESWSEKKKAQMNDMPHQVKPDLDNCVKAVFDTVNKSDQTIFKLICEKRWGYKGQIIIMQ